MATDVAQCVRAHFKMSQRHRLIIERQTKLRRVAAIEQGRCAEQGVRNTPLNLYHTGSGRGVLLEIRGHHSEGYRDDDTHNHHVTQCLANSANQRLHLRYPDCFRMIYRV
ncbi:hypothetical protein BOC42_19530 [Burkholderia pseudomallei]|nr:hypothetical protein BOC42_19530 [Burkholderia pseudomallei]